MIIRQKDTPLVLSGWRNLGTVLRIVLVVNIGVELTVIAQAHSLKEVFTGFLAPAVYAEPYLFLELSLLWLSGPSLSKLTLRAATLAVTAITLFCGIVVDLLAFSPSWTHTLYVLFWGLVAEAFLLYYFTLRDKALSPAITEAKLQALQSRIRPHFLFNSINAVMAIIRYDPVRAEEALQDMADMFRALMRDNRELAPLSAELELCRQYLAIEKLRLGDKLNVVWQNEHMPEDAMIPPLILQPLLENAVLHGIENAPKGGDVTINIFVSHGVLSAVLRNPYYPRETAHQKGNRIALDNVKQRLALHFDAEAALETRIIDDAIFEAKIRMPYLAENKSNTENQQKDEG